MLYLAYSTVHFVFKCFISKFLGICIHWPLNSSIYFPIFRAISMYCPWISIYIALQYLINYYVRLRPYPHVSGNFCILQFFYADTACVHTYLPYFLALSGNFCIDRSPKLIFLSGYKCGYVWTAYPEIFLSADVTLSNPVFLEYGSLGSLRSQAPSAYARNAWLRRQKDWTLECIEAV